MYLKIIRNFFYSNTKKTNKTNKKTGTNFDLTTDNLIEKYHIISVIFEIRISQQILHKQRSLNQSRHCLTGRT